MHVSFIVQCQALTRKPNESCMFNIPNLIKRRTNNNNNNNNNNNGVYGQISHLSREL